MSTVSVQVDDRKLLLARENAAAQNKTLEQMLERFIDVLAQSSFDPAQLGPHTRAALGIAKGVPDRPYKDLITDALSEKYEREK